jgi:DNA-binding beta-propeller fold protein YncE
VSPDKKTLLILTSGYNRLNDPTTGKGIASDSNEYVFVFDISNKIPIKKQVLQVPNTYYGIVFDPSDTTFYLAGGVNDNIHIFDFASGTSPERAGNPLTLGHTSGIGNGVPPAAAGLAISADGKKLAVANYYNDSISILTKTDSGCASR